MTMRAWTRAGWRLLLVMGFALPAVAEEPGRPLHLPGLAAEVGGAPVFLDTVLEIWGPVWHDARARVRAGRLAPAEADRQLREEWRKALEAAVKDELFYREAVREFRGMVAEAIDQAYENARRSSSRGGGAPANRAFIERELTRDIEQAVEQGASRLEAHYVQAGGGPQALQKSLVERGVSYADWRERLRRKAFTGMYFSRRGALHMGRPGPGRIQAYYRDHPEEFRKPDAVRFRHLFFSTEKRGAEAAYQAAADAWAELVQQPERFDELARALSDDPVSAARGGQDVYDSAPDSAGRDWLADVAKAAAEEPRDAIGPVLESPYGYHVAMLAARIPGGRTPFSEVRDAIEGKLAAEAESRELDRLYESLRRDVPIRILAPDFPERYTLMRESPRPAAPPGRRIGGSAYPDAP